jgi:hypothetical protein
MEHNPELEKTEAELEAILRKERRQRPKSSWTDAISSASVRIEGTDGAIRQSD